MYAYEFINKGNVTMFRCLNEPYVSIDKEDMVHVLSAEGNWMSKNGEIQLALHPKGEKTKLADYILNGKGHNIRHINNNPLDFRKKNLLINKHNHTPYFIRPLTTNDVPIFPEKSDADTLRFFHIIRKNHQPIGYFATIPVEEPVYKQFLAEDIPKEKALSSSSSYENDADYYHIIMGRFPKEKKLYAYIRHYYQQLLFHLRLRNIHIEEAMTFKEDSFSESMEPSFTQLQAANPHIIRLNIQDF